MLYEGQAQNRYAPELARAEYKMARLLEVLGKKGEAETWMQKARNRLRQVLGVTNNDFTESAFDNAVVIWSR
jgi:hypothetical protein